MENTELMERARKRLFEKHKPNEAGVWRIYGEDPNCDFGGHHHEPELALVEGRYGDIVEHALTLDRFFQWGSGGRIEKLAKPKKIDPDSNRRRATLENQKKKLLAQVDLIEKELESI